MKIILSRKGFDCQNGGCPNPIFPDGTMISLPIPSNDTLGFNDIVYNGKTYQELLKELTPNAQYHKCHLDPDIRMDVRKNVIKDWKPAFGQISQAQSYLANSGVKENDIFLFFGRFQDVIKNDNGEWKYNSKSPIKHIIFGYMQVGNILLDKEKIKEYYWHPHSSEDRLQISTNALYLPTERISFLPNNNGYGVWNYDEKRVLTLDGKSMATWKEYSFLQPDNVIGNRKNSAKDEGIYYRGIWQELVLKENIDAFDWVKTLF